MKLPKNYPSQQPDQKNLLLAVVMCAALVLGWQFFIEAPKRAQLSQFTQQQEIQKKEALVKQQAGILKPGEADARPMTREQLLAMSPRVRIASDTLNGTIALKGLRFDDLTLTKYRTTLDKESPPVTLLSPAGDAGVYFAQAGWLAEGKKLKLPDDQTMWQTDKAELTPASPVTFKWNNGEGLTFSVTVALDANYMFTLTQQVTNNSGDSVTLVPYALVNRTYIEPAMHSPILHEGPLGVMSGALSEIQYSDLRENGKQEFSSEHGWVGFTDKYWLAALVPTDKNFKASFEHYTSRGIDRYQSEYSGATVQVASGESHSANLRLFAGAKESGALNAYAKGTSDANQPPIQLFDRAIDFGYLYFLTKPMMLYLLTPFFHLTGNFGIAILLLTIVVKLLMFPLANKGYHTTTAMRALQPEMLKLRDKYADDKMKMQTELLALYKKEKVNPASGCLPILVQIPVFFALYKVLFVTIEMRHAPFFGWLQDLSEPDPSNMFTLFGLIPWQTPHLLHIGILPILMGVTMALQMRQQPTPTDPIQAKVIKFMPIMLTVMLAKMPAGLVLYWTWSNVLSILQQWYITWRYNARHARKA